MHLNTVIFIFILIFASVRANFAEIVLSSPGVFSHSDRDVQVTPWTIDQQFEGDFGRNMMGYKWTRPLYRIPFGMLGLVPTIRPDQCYFTEVRNLAYSLEDYELSWVINGLPAVSSAYPGASSLFPLVESNNGVNVLNNFWIFILHIQVSKDGSSYELVGVEAKPKSASVTKSAASYDCANVNERKPLLWNSVAFNEPKSDPYRIIFAFSFRVVLSENRNFDGYKSSVSHLWGFVNGTVIFLFLAAMLSLVVMRINKTTLTRQLQGDDLQEESGWKIVRYDIFRHPTALPLPLALCVGIGSQLLVVFGVVVLLSVSGILSPFSPPSFVLAAALVFSLTGFANGFFAARAYRLMGFAQHWLWCLGLSAAIPGGVMTISYIIMLPFWSSSSASSFFSIVAMWIFAHAPTSLLGGFVAMKVLEPVALPVGVSEEPRAVPKMVWYLDTKVLILLAGALPFGTIMSISSEILASIWLRQYFVSWAFLTVSFFYFVFCCGFASVVMVYCQLCCEDYQWWWRSFIFAASSGMYFLFYSMYFGLQVLSPNNYLQTISSQICYTVSNVFIALLLSLLAGAIGFYCNLFFLMRIYSDTHFS